MKIMQNDNLEWFLMYCGKIIVHKANKKLLLLTENYIHTKQKSKLPNKY